MAEEHVPSSAANASAVSREAAAGILEPPTGLGGTLRRIGPGMIITASIVGSGELIMTTATGAKAGFTLLWFLVLGCMVKVFVQIELGRYTIAAGTTTVESLNLVPGPRWRVSWLVWFWLVMYILVYFQVAGIVGGVAKVFVSQTGEDTLALWVWVVAGSCAILLAVGRYRLVEKVSTTMVAVFTLFTIYAVGALAWTPYSISFADLTAGFSFNFPEADASGGNSTLTIAFATFGIIGVGASELIYYPYWCLEKGYARFVGPPDGTPEWTRRARGWIRVMYVDAWLSLVVYTLATVAFYLLGAAILHAQNRQVENDELIGTLSRMYAETPLGETGVWIFLIGAFMVLYSTFFVSTASNARLFADALSVFRIWRYRDDNQRRVVIKFACAGIAIYAAILFLYFEKPVTLVTVGALSQAFMLPFLGIAALYLRYVRVDRELRPGTPWSLFLWLSFLLMGTLAVYQIWEKLTVLLFSA